MCDFGISGKQLLNLFALNPYFESLQVAHQKFNCVSGYLVDSVAKTIDAGCKRKFF